MGYRSTKERQMLTSLTFLPLYCNAILAGTADTVIKRLRSVQKTAARLVSGTIFRDHYHYFTQPHWLLVWRRIVSKSTILSLPIWTLHMTG